MAYGLKYYLEFGDDPLHGNTWRVEIHKDGYVGSSSSIKGTGKPCTVAWKGGGIFEPIRGSECTLEMYSESNFQFEEFFTASELEFIVLIKKNGSEWWNGVFVTESYNEPYVDTPYPVKLRFSDGLGILKYIKYEDAGNIKTGIAKWISIVNFCLAKLPYSINLVEIINILEEGTADIATFGFLNTVNINQEAMTILNKNTGETDGWKCYEVLKQLLVTLGCTMYQFENKWYIVRIEELENATPSYIEYNAGLGSVASSGTISIRETITNNAATGITWLLQDADLSPSDVFDEITCIYQFGSPEEPSGELIKDWDYDLNGSANSFAQRWNYWDVSVAAPGGTSLSWDKEELTVDGSASMGGYTFDQDEWVIKFHPGGGTYNGNRLGDVFEDTLYMRALQSPNATFTKENIIVTTNDNFNIVFGPFRVWYYILGYHDSGGSPHNEILSYVYEFEFRFQVRIGTRYVEEDANGDLSWGTDSSATIARKFQIVWNEAEESWLVHPSIGAPESDMYSLFRFEAISIDLPKFAANELTDVDVKVYYPVAPWIWHNVAAYRSSHAELIQSAKFGCKLIAGDNALLNEKLTVSINESLRDRAKEITVKFGDGPHRAIINSFLVDDPLTVGSYKDTQNWYYRGTTIDSFAVTGVNDDGSGNAQYGSSIDTHSFVVGDYVIGSAFIGSTSGNPVQGYNTFQKVTNVLSSILLDTDATYTENVLNPPTNDPILKGYLSSTNVFIVKPYAKYFGQYRRELNGTLFGELEFYKTIVSRDSKLYMKSSMSYDIKSSQYAVELLELPAATVPHQIQEYKGKTPNQATITNPSSLEPGLVTEYANSNTAVKPVNNSTNINIQKSSGQITQVNDTKANLDNFKNYPQ